jgi:hypothetical protein
MSIKFKKGQPVKGTSARGTVTHGRFHATRKTPRGDWIDINVAPPRKPEVLKSYRPTKVAAA